MMYFILVSGVQNTRAVWYSKTAKNVGHYSIITVHDSSQNLMVPWPEEACVLSRYCYEDCLSTFFFTSCKLDCRLNSGCVKCQEPTEISCSMKNPCEVLYKQAKLSLDSYSVQDIIAD